MSTDPTPDRTLFVDFSWRKYTCIIRENEESEPLYLQKWNGWTMKSTFKTGAAVTAAMQKDPDAVSINSDASTLADDTDIIGTSRVRAVHIDIDATHRGRALRISAAKKLMTRYNYASLAYATDPHKPAVMTWKANSWVKCFDFDLLDESGRLVARFNPKYFGIKKFASVEMFGPLAWDKQATEEVLITGLSMYMCMVYRSMSWVPLVGAIVARPGKDYKVTEKEAHEEYERNVEAARMAQAGGHLKPDGSSGDVDHDKMWEHVNEGAIRR
ncbi:hypothetical protein EJ04DRAFT_513619 [Polyplosphaeria fusca]|uniref:Uncharacterized protein n=1 Tax=Polyplosphaeria fusca TaxID=682080 RepID=A0A9P4V231_9PLEO|nr:hypothetical protein EJ04DRAFT_513619 [Polyplosphaeria fusca]